MKLIAILRRLLDADIEISKYWEGSELGAGRKEGPTFKFVD
jgi:hypothetical protein